MITIREFRPDDVDLYMQIRLEALASNPNAFNTTAEDFQRQPRTFHEKRLTNNWESADIVVLCALEDERPVGMMGLIRETHPKRRHTATVIAVFVSATHRGQGLGGQLLDELISRAHRMGGVEQLYLSVVSDNAAAIALYKSRGFTRYGHAPRIKKWRGQYVDDDLMVLYF